MQFVTWFCGVFTLIGIVVAILSTRTLFRAKESGSWPFTNGRIKESIIGRASRDGRGSFKPLITYIYSVDQIEYENDLISYGLGHYSGSIEFARRYIDRYPENASINVYYNPFFPKTSVLEPGLTKNAFIPLGFGLLFAIAGVLFFCLALHQEAKRPNKALQLTPSRHAFLFTTDLPFFATRFRTSTRARGS
jgi:hypothetical protein